MWRWILIIGVCYGFIYDRGTTVDTICISSAIIISYGLDILFRIEQKIDSLHKKINYVEEKLNNLNNKFTDGINYLANGKFYWIETKIEDLEKLIKNKQIK